MNVLKTRRIMMAQLVIAEALEKDAGEEADRANDAADARRGSAIDASENARGDGQRIASAIAGAVVSATGAAVTFGAAPSWARTAGALAEAGTTTFVNTIWDDGRAEARRADVESKSAARASAAANADRTASSSEVDSKRDGLYDLLSHQATR